MVAEALDAGKHVFVEKPLALDAEGLERVGEAYERSAGQQLMVGFNRRFAPLIVQMKQLLRGRSGPLCMSMLVNAGAIPADHWVHDPQVGGGRIVGEGCHWLDLLRFLADAPIVHAQASHLGGSAAASTRDDHCSISLVLADGSLGTLHYFANGHRTFPKERLTVFADGKVLEMDNFRALNGFGFAAFRRRKSLRQDKGHLAECRQFIDRVVQGGEPLIPFDQLWNVTETSLRCQWGSGADSPQPATA
jgi:predicted dehydrogenase